VPDRLNCKSPNCANTIILGRIVIGCDGCGYVCDVVIATLFSRVCMVSVIYGSLESNCRWRIELMAVCIPSEVR